MTSACRGAKAAIEGRLGIRVLLTRDDDRNVPIDERTAIANNNKADVFISVHLNGSFRRSASGASIFCASFDEAARKAAASSGAERLPTFGGGLRDIDLVRWDLAQTRHIDQSTTLAGILEQQFRAASRWRRGQSIARRCASSNRRTCPRSSSSWAT